MFSFLFKNPYGPYILELIPFLVAVHILLMALFSDRCIWPVQFFYTFVLESAILFLVYNGTPRDGHLALTKINVED